MFRDCGIHARGLFSHGWSALVTRHEGVRITLGFVVPGFRRKQQIPTSAPPPVRLPSAIQNRGRTLDQWVKTVRLADDTGNVHTPTMTLKNAALLALIGTILATALLVWTLVVNVLNVLRGLAPAVMLFSWFIYAFACFSVAVFFYVFHRAQS